MAKPQKRPAKAKTKAARKGAVRKPQGAAVPKVAEAPPHGGIGADDVVGVAEAEALVRPGRRVTVESVTAIAATPAKPQEAPPAAALQPERPRVNGLHWPAAEAPRASWWQRVKRRLDWRHKRPDGMPEHLAAVKAGVLHELEALGLEKGVPLQGGPFRSVVLPTVRRKPRWGWPLVILLGLVLLAVMVLVGRGPADPAKVLAQAMSAAVSGDVSGLEARVDVGGVARSVINQTFNTPQLDLAALPPELRAQVQRGAEGGLAARMNADIKPGLAANLRDEVLAAVKAGRIAPDATLLAKLWRDLGGNALRIGAPRVMASDARTAMAEVPLHRSDLGLTLPLQVMLGHTREGWQVVDIPNMAAVLDGMENAEAAKLAGAPAAAPGASGTPGTLADRVQVLDVVKAKGTTVGDSLMVTMRVHNTGSVPLRDVQLQVAFGDAAGQPMKTATVTLDGVLGAGQSREQTWAIPIDRDRSAERYVADLPLSALSVKVLPVGAR